MLEALRVQLYLEGDWEHKHGGYIESEVAEWLGWTPRWLR
jgi:hypothetical protein